MKKMRKGYTLVELLMVISIIGILTSILVPTALRMKAKSYRQAAEAMISTLECALETYNSEWGVYPPSGVGATQYNGNSNVSAITTTLVERLTATEKGGPYMEFKVEELDTSVDGKPVLLDPWGMPYVYTCDHDGLSTTAPFHNVESYDLYSLGPDYTTSSGGEANDEHSEWFNEDSDGDCWADDNPSKPNNDDDINNW